MWETVPPPMPFSRSADAVRICRQKNPCNDIFLDIICFLTGLNGRFRVAHTADTDKKIIGGRGVGAVACISGRAGLASYGCIPKTVRLFIFCSLQANFPSRENTASPIFALTLRERVLAAPHGASGYRSRKRSPRRVPS
jgi:hypothetical protein